MKTLIFVDYDADTGEAVCRFADGFSGLARQQQLEIAEAVRERMESLAVSLQALIARSSAGNP